MIDSTRAEHYERLAAQLSALRPVLLADRNQRFLDFFDEFMGHREFGLALHTLCDFILEPGSPRVSEAILSQIQNLHATMRIEDDCVERLRRQKLA